MKKRRLNFSCADNACQQLAEIISAYSLAAFPIGGSECAQATRESLLDMASRLSKCEEASSLINTRQIPMLRSAINWYYSEIETDNTQQKTLLMQLKRH